jgi:hypothetical protein
LLFLAEGVATQGPERVAVILPDCPEAVAWRREVGELLRVELQVDHASQVEVTEDPNIAQRLPALWVQRACAALGGEPVQLRASDPQRGAVLERTLGLHDVPLELQSRVIALALAELLRAGWPSPLAVAALEADAAPLPAEPDAVAAAPQLAGPDLTAVDSGVAEARSGRLPSTSRIALALGPALHVSLRGAPVLYGAELSLSWWQLSVGALGYLGSVNDAIGDIAVKRLHGFAAFDVLQIERGAWIWTAAVRGGAGGTFANAHAIGTARSTASSDFSCDGSLEAGLGLRLAAEWALRLRASFGLAYSPAYRADERVIADYSGWFTGISLSVARELARVEL